MTIKSLISTISINMNDPEGPKLEASSPALISGGSFWNPLGTSVNFLPDFTEHPKPKKKRKPPQDVPQDNTVDDDDKEEPELTFIDDFIAGGAAGCASVIVGHPFDTIKVRIQTSKNPSMGVMATLTEFGGPASLFRGMAAPLASAAVINAIVFSSYGIGSRLFDEHIVDPDSWPETDATHDPWQKSWTCGSFAGLVQCTVICPMEHIKCRLQVQQGTGSGANYYKGPLQAVKGITQQYGIRRLYQGWWSTALREVPAFGLYFVTYDYMKDQANSFLSRHSADPDSSISVPKHSHTWIASAFAGGCAGCLTWAIVYPVDVIKTHVQTAALDTPLSKLSMFHVGKSLAAQHGWRYLFRGLGITLVRAFPVNGTIFPVYEFVLLQIGNNR
jgi:solute carrier family 25 carnitine/acylcarnitine transporter 20/29